MSKITPLGIKAALAEAKACGEDKYLSDDTGQRLGWRLSLRCMPSGSATWIFRYTHDGKRHPIPLGSLDTLDIQPAREAAAKYAAIYRNYPDVLGKLQADEQAKQAAIQAEQEKAAAEEASRLQQVKYTLAALMTMYINHLEKNGKRKSAGDVTSLSKHLAPIANKPAAEISKLDLVTVQRKLIDAGKGRTANKLRSFVHAAYALVLKSDRDATAPATALEFATAGRVAANPAALTAVAKGYNRTRSRVLTNDELFQLLDDANQSGVVGHAVRATILTGGQRIAQLLRATVNDVQDDFLTLLDRKGNRDEPRPHPIPLEGKAGDVIAEAVDRAKSLGTIYLFSTDGKVALNPSTVSDYVAEVSARYVETGISTTPFQLADLRRTIETRLAGLKVPKDYRSHLQSHGLSGVQTRHYDRHEYEEEKRHALRVLHAWIDSRGKYRPKIAPLHRR